MSKIKIGIIVGGRFHAFDLARELNKKKLLNFIITSYPKYFLKKFKINKKKVKSIFVKEVLHKLLIKIPFFSNRFDIDLICCNYFDFIASKLIDFKKINILVGWSSFSQKSFIEARKYNCVKVLERGSAHIVYQKEILKKEYLKLGIKPRLPSNELVKKELLEYDLADFIMVPSEFVKKSFLTQGIDKKKIIKISYGVDLKEFNIDKSIKKKKNFFRIISTGTVSVRKGSLDLIKVFNDLNLPNSELIFVGKVDDELKDIIPISNNIKFFGAKKQNELKYYYNISNLFILNSIEDGFGMVIPQAMACGLPIITTKNTGASEIVTEGLNGYIIPSGNNLKLKKKIKFLYDNKKILNQMSLQSYKKAFKSLSWNDYGKKMAYTYQKFLTNEKNYNSY